MVNCNCSIEKKDFADLFVCWSRKRFSYHIRKMLLFLCLFVLAYAFIERDVPLILIQKNNGMFSLLITLIAGLDFVIFITLFLGVVIYEYILAEQYWKRKLMIKDMDTWIKAISFYEEYIFIEGFIFHMEAEKKIFYKDFDEINVCKQGIVLTNRKIKKRLFISKNQFFTREDYEVVCRWVQKKTLVEE